MFSPISAHHKIPKPSKWLTFYKRQSKSCSGTANSSQTKSREPKQTSSRSEDVLKEVFRHFDCDGDGRISAFELRSYFGSVGEYISHEEVQGVIDDLDSDGDNLLGFEDFMRLMKRDGEEDDDEEGVIKEAFEMFEIEKGSGSITPKSLQRMLQRLGDVRSYDECKAMISAFDIDGNGVLDFHEFQQMMA